MTVSVAEVINDNSEDPVSRLVRALERHGFQATPQEAGFCGGDVPGPCIPVFRFVGDEQEQQRLTELVIEFYNSTTIPEQVPRDRDTRLRVEEAFDKTVDGELEFDYELSFDGLEVLVLMPREIFDIHPNQKRSIEDRYRAKIERFADFLENREPTSS